MSDCKNPLVDLTEKRNEIISWFLKNKNVDKKQKIAKAKELERLNIQIEAFRSLENSEKEIQKEDKPVNDLLYRKNCYEF